MKKMNQSNQTEVFNKNFIRIILESWRLKKSFERAIVFLDYKEQKKNLSKIKWFDNVLQEVMENSKLKLVNFEGEPFTSGIPATAVNIEDFDSEDELYVKQTIEPTILDENAAIVHSGSIIVEKV
ncbi:MAG: hypothetical protein IKP71_14405 [Candidatus Riflebacteria bacterium]|nr:hypothetical protein [Candidatus Riflebacteria bacterium]